MVILETFALGLGFWSFLSLLWCSFGVLALISVVFTEVRMDLLLGHKINQEYWQMFFYRIHPIALLVFFLILCIGGLFSLILSVLFHVYMIRTTIKDLEQGIFHE